MGELVLRRGTIALFVCTLLAGAAPGGAANKDMERLQLQVATLQSQIGDLVRAHEDSLKELRRLNELLADQNASLKKTLQEQRVQEEANAAALRDLGERLSELNEKYQSLKATPPPPVATDVSGFTPPAGDVPGTTPPVGASPAPSPAAPAPASAPAPRELYSQAYADFARGNYDLAVQGFTEYIKNYPGTDFTDNAQYWVGECLYGKKLTTRPSRPGTPSSGTIRRATSCPTRGSRKGWPWSVWGGVARPWWNTDSSSTASRTRRRRGSPGSA